MASEFMADDPKYTESIRKLTTAAETDDAVTAGRILSELGPEKWNDAVKDMMALNRKDWRERPLAVIPIISAEMEKNGNKETLKIVQQPTRDDAELQPVAEVVEDTNGKKVDSPVDPASPDLLRKLTSAAEDGDAVATARILNAIGAEKWGQVTKDMVALNREDRRKVLEDPNNTKKLPARLTVSYKKDGPFETIKVYHEADMQLRLPLAKVTGQR